LLLKILVIKNKSWRIIDLALDLNIGTSEITMELERLRISGLIDSEKSKPH
jgi:predicted transcriptional regulator